MRRQDLYDTLLKQNTMHIQDMVESLKHCAKEQSFENWKLFNENVL
jgi:hypothetical protein